MILDIGPQTRVKLRNLLKNAGTIVWNGPVGVFEIDQFGGGTQALAEAIALSPAFSLAGGGDRKIRRRPEDQLHLDRRRRVPRVHGRQDAAGGRGPEGARGGLKSRSA